MLRSIAGDPLEALWVVYLTTRLRCGQALGLRWMDLDLDAGTVWPRRAVLRLSGELRTDEEAKTQESAERKPLARMAIDALSAHRQSAEAAGLYAPAALVFLSKAGTPIEPATSTGDSSGYSLVHARDMPGCTTSARASARCCWRTTSSPASRPRMSGS